MPPVHPRIQVSDNRRYLINDDGSPFFYLADTAWELFHRLDADEATWYLRDRAAKRFTVIQAVVLAECDGLRVPNAGGDLPLHDEDPTRPNDAYFAHVDTIVDMAAVLGLTIGMLPTWGDKWNQKWGKGPEVFTPENARVYGQFLGDRYRDRPVIWILGGDRPIEGEAHVAILRAMADGLREGDGRRHLITFHPMGGHGSSTKLHDEPWLDFNMVQSGHDRNRANYEMVDGDYARTPVKPCMDAEPGYEDHPAGFKLENGYLEEYDVRKSAYWSLFAGAHGHTYGCHPIWQMWRPGLTPHSFVRRRWQEAVHLPGSGQMRHARALIESRPYLTRIPDPGILLGDPGADTRHVRATRDEEGSYAMLYIPSPRSVTLDTSRLAGSRLVVYWFDPRLGLAIREGTIARGNETEFTPPPGGPDWVLVLDDADRHYPAPGSRSLSR